MKPEGGERARKNGELMAESDDRARHHLVTAHSASNHVEKDVVFQEQKEI